jgi:hypothetical protein
MATFDVRTYNGPPIFGRYYSATFLFDDAATPQTHVLLGRNDVRIVSYTPTTTIPVTTVATTTTAAPPVGNAVGLSKGSISSESPAIIGDTGGISSVTTFISPESSIGTAAGACTALNANGSQQAGYVAPADENVGLLWPLPGGVAPIDPADISPTGPNVDLSRTPDRMVMFNNPFCDRVVWQGQLQIRDGKLLIVPPVEVLRNPAIYNMEVVWTQLGKTMRNTATLSVEQSLYNRALFNGTHGPITLSRIRTRMRDWPAANDTSGDYEYSAAEICTAMLEAVEYYNETPPWSGHFTVAEFPYRLRLMDATIARMLMTSGQWMMRNQATIQASGVTSDTRDKYFRVIQLSQALWKEYTSFVLTDKANRSIARGYVSIH